MNMDVAPRRVLVIAAGGHAGIVLARALPADGLLILMDADPIRGATARERFVDAGLADRASVIIGDPSRMLYKIAGPFDVIVHEDDLARNAPLRQTLVTLLRPGGRLVTKSVMGSDLVLAALERIEHLNPSLNAFITVLAAEALADDRPDGPLHDRPISIKDIIDVAGVPTTAASRVRAGHVARSDAPAVARLRRAGAAIIAGGR